MAPGVGVMTSARKRAEAAGARILQSLSADGKVDATAVLDVIEQTLCEAAREQEKRELHRVAVLRASAHVRLSRLLDASPAAIYSRLATGNFEPTFVSESITRLFDVSSAKISICHV
jgi:adenylate cyclase